MTGMTSGDDLAPVCPVRRPTQRRQSRRPSGAPEPPRRDELRPGLAAGWWFGEAGDERSDAGFHIGESGRPEFPQDAACGHRADACLGLNVQCGGQPCPGWVDPAIDSFFQQGVHLPPPGDFRLPVHDPEARCTRSTGRVR